MRGRRFLEVSVHKPDKRRKHPGLSVSTSKGHPSSRTPRSESGVRSPNPQARTDWQRNPTPLPSLGRKRDTVP
jgi:hypothetical protein